MKKWFKAHGMYAESHLLELTVNNDDGALDGGVYVALTESITHNAFSVITVEDAKRLRDYLTEILEGA